jgi:transcriptional regulator with XRE-family HTH domain
VIGLREALSLNQQDFANRLSTAITTVARWETSRPPSGIALSALAKLADESGQGDFALAFISELIRETNLREIKGSHLQVDASGENPKGTLLIHIEGQKSKAYARAIHENFRRFEMGTDDEKKQAEALLNDLVAKTWRKK